MRYRSLVFVLSLVACAAESQPAPETAEAPAAPPPAPLFDVALEPSDEALLAWSFEPASANCNGWRADGATAIRSVPPRSGTYACMMCSDGVTTEVSLSKEVRATKGRYTVSAWVRGRADFPAVARTHLEVASGSAKLAATDTLAVTDAWQHVETTIDLADETPRLRVAIHADGTEEKPCFLVDDVVVTRVRD